MSGYDWRSKWQPKTRGGFEVVDVRSMVADTGLQFCIIKDGWITNPLYSFDDGRYMITTHHEFDLLPVEQRTDTEGRDVTGLYGLHDESDSVNTIAALTAERDRLLEAAIYARAELSNYTRYVYGGKNREVVDCIAELDAAIAKAKHTESEAL